MLNNYNILILAFYLFQYSTIHAQESITFTQIPKTQFGSTTLKPTSTIEFDSTMSIEILDYNNDGYFNDQIDPIKQNPDLISVSIKKCNIIAGKSLRKTTTILFNNTSYTFNFFFLTKLGVLIKNNPAPLKHDIEISDKIPIGYLVDSKNKPVDMNTLINDKYLYTLFYFWSHTCAGCHIELKRLNDFPEKFKSKNVRIILVSPLEEKSNIMKLEKKYQNLAPQYFCTLENMHRKWNAIGYPYKVISTKNKVVYFHSLKDLHSIIEKLSK